jgi:hypothetical protein
MSSPRYRKGVAIKISAVFVTAIAVYALWVSAWSKSAEKLEPVHLGVDACHHCGMIVSDMNFEISVLDSDSMGHPVTRHFDDPGCFKEFAKAHLNTKWVGVAHDHRTGREIPLAEARFLETNVETPMGSGIVVEAK